MNQPAIHARLTCLRRLVPAAVVLWVLGCGGGGPARESGGTPPPPASAAAPARFLRIGDNTFESSQFQAFREKLFRSIDVGGSLGSAENTAILNHFVEERLVLVAAREAGLQITDEDRQAIAGTLGLFTGQPQPVPDEEILVQKFLKTELAPRIQVTDAEVEEYYKRHQWEYVAQDVYHVREILVESQNLARQIEDELLSGEKSRFGAYARQFSVAPSAAAGGDLGYFHRGDLPPDFEKIILAIKPGGFGPVIRTQYGFHIFYLEERIRAHPQKLFEVRNLILETIRLEKERQAQQQLLDDLYQRYRPVVYRKVLDFEPDRELLARQITLEESHAF